MTWFAKTAGVLGDVGLAVALALLVPVVIVVIGAPVVLLVRAILAIVERL